MFRKCYQVLSRCKRSVIILSILLNFGLASAQESVDLDSFFRAVTDGRAELAAQILRTHPDWVNRELYLGIRPLYRAAVLGRAETVQLLLESGAQVSAPTDRGSHALHAASQNGHLAVVMLLLASKAQVQAQNESGATPLHLAARYKRSKVMRELLKNGADPNIRDKAGRVPLHFAAGLGQVELVQRLVEAGAELDVVDGSGYSPLGWARHNKRNSYGDVGGYLESKGAPDIRPQES